MADSVDSDANLDPSDAEDILTVEELNKRVDAVVGSAPDLNSVRCVGEVTNLSESNTALYFTLTDGDHEISCVLWQSRYREMDLDLEDGVEIVLEGKVDYWIDGGQISLKPWAVTPVGEGDQAAAIARLERELEARGWFNDDRKQDPPWFPERIGVVTSLQGDARYDIQNAIHGQDPTVDIVIKEATVQGQNAPESIANGIHYLDRHEEVDLIIAGRGGGSDTDLMAFNTVEVAEAIFTASTPTITAVGHTEDRLIADRVADRAAITPTQAGEEFAGSRTEFIEARLDPLERELEDAYAAFERQHEHEVELGEGERKLAFYRAGIVVLLVLLLVVLFLWQVI